jgi:predicted nucleic acid-binding protein
MLVIDASAALEWLLDDSMAVQSEAIIRRCLSEPAWTPSLFWLEVGNTLRMRLRRGVIDLAFRDVSLRRLRRVGLQTDSEANFAGAPFDRSIELSDRYDLTLYDASYLELALRLGADIATFDEALASAAARSGVSVTGRG